MKAKRTGVSLFKKKKKKKIVQDYKSQWKELMKMERVLKWKEWSEMFYGFQKQSPGGVLVKVFLKILLSSQENTCARVSSLIRLQYIKNTDQK